MERTDELSSQPAMPSPPSNFNPPQNPNSNLSSVPPIAREEGELSSSDDDDDHQRPDRSASPSAGTAAPSASFQSVHASPTNELPQGNQEAKNVRNNTPVSPFRTHVQASLQQKNRKNSPKNQPPPKTAASRRIVQQDNQNLVISFSDDESSSSSDDSMRTGQVKTQGGVDAMHGNRNSSDLTTEGLKKYGQVRKSVNQNMPRQPSFGRIFAPSNMKNQGAYQRGDEVLAGSQGRFSRNNILKKRMEGQVLGSNHNVGSKNFKLHDLRHQIALRESELKLRSAQLSRPPASGACRDPEALNSSGDSARALTIKSSNITGLGPKDPPSKRLKIGPSSYSRQIMEQEIPAARSVSPPKVLMLQSSKTDKIDHVQAASSGAITESSTDRLRRQDSEKMVVPSQDLHQSKQDGIEKESGGLADGASRKSNHALIVDHNLSANVMAINALPEKTGSREMQSLIEIEESLDKELADAQEYRRTCEIEERNALKAYRKAQRALLEANARCAHLYQQRELYSSRLRSCILDDSALLGCPSGHDYFAIQTESPNDIFKKVPLMPLPSQQKQTEDDQFLQPVFTSNPQCDGFALDSSYQPMNGHGLGSEPVSEPGSMSEPLNRNNNPIPGESSSNDQIMSADEYEDTLPFDSRKSHNGYDRGGRTTERRTDILCESGSKASNNNFQDSLSLEATLRSELFAKLGARPRNSRASDSNVKFMVEVSQGDVESRKPDKSNKRGVSSEVARVQYLNSGGNRQEGGQDVTSVISMSTFSSRSAFHHVETGIQRRNKLQQQYDEPDLITNENFINSGEIDCMPSILNSPEKIALDLCDREASSYFSDVAVDPFWPLCIFELRGKCNNDECPWQHVKDFSVGKTSRNVHGDSNGGDCQVALTSNGQCCSATAEHSKSQAPIYLVGLDILRADLRSYDSVVAGKVGQPWQKCFSISLAIPGFFKQVLNADDSVLQNNDGRFEAFGCWTSQSSYFRNRNRRVSDLEQASVGIDQSLETALLLLNQEADKFEGKRKALSMLSRALEASPTSVVLWITYLVIYYSKTKPFGRDDMYPLAVELNQGSYELWLMYINSRTKLNDRFAAYEEALSALRDHIYSSDEEMSHSSSCILDLFLQMIDCYCMSGNTDKAIQMIYNLLPHPEKSSNERFNSLISYILSSCLTISDKYTFWICCVYVVIYRKLPDAIVQQFECDKDVRWTEWSPAHLTDEERGKVNELMEFAVSNFGSCISNELNKHAKLAQSFAVSHIRFKVAIYGLERSRELLDRYVKMYPTCLDLVLMTARVENYDFEGLSFHGFENAITKWPKGVDGYQCLWNQYAEYALRSGKADFAKELMGRWYSSVWKPKYPESDMDQTDSLTLLEDSDRPYSVSISSDSASESSGLDEFYGLLNLSLHKLLQKQYEEAYAAINQALKAANHGDYANCVREHFEFILAYEFFMKDSSDISVILNHLNEYLTDSRASPVREPLSRKFIEDVNKPRVQQLIKNILCPMSTNFIIVNSVLDSLFGPDLLPRKFGKAKDMVDFVEAILEISPSNYPLAISVCRTIAGKDHDSAPTSVSFWAASVLVGTLSHAVPIAPESTWVEAATLLANIAGFSVISEGFYKRALSAYPFSVNLWKSYYHYAKSTGEGDHIILEAAKEKGIRLDQ